MLKWVLTLSAVYLAAIGLALMLVPLRFGVGAVPADAAPELIALMRLLGENRHGRGDKQIEPRRLGQRGFGASNCRV